MCMRPPRILLLLCCAALAGAAVPGARSADDPYAALLAPSGQCGAAADHGLATHAMRSADYGTSAIIAAWIGVVAYAVWRRGSGAAALALCVVSGLIGWLFRPDLDVLDTEHIVALAIGIALAATIGAGAAASSGAGWAASLGQASPQTVRSRAARSPAEAKT